MLRRDFRKYTRVDLNHWPFAPENPVVGSPNLTGVANMMMLLALQSF